MTMQGLDVMLDALRPGPHAASARPFELCVFFESAMMVTRAFAGTLDGLRRLNAAFVPIYRANPEHVTGLLEPG